MGEMTEEAAIRDIMLGIKDPVSANPAELSDGDIVGVWKIRAKVGAGGFGNVYRVEHIKSGAIAALKILSKFDEESRSRFELETEILQAIHASPKSAKKYFPAYLGTGDYQAKERKIPYVVSEFLSPLRLSDSDEKVGKFIMQVCDAVEELHRNGYLHRDIKSLNILMRNYEDGSSAPVLIDFGGAIRIKDASNPDIRSRVSMEYGELKGFGTLFSSAPEQAHGQASVRSDVYALGALITECFKGDTPENWQRIVLKATSPRPENRYQSVSEMKRAIHRRIRPSKWTYVGRTAWILGICGALGITSMMQNYVKGLFKSETNVDSKREIEETAPIEVVPAPVSEALDVEENVDSSSQLDPKAEAIKALEEGRFTDCFDWAQKANKEDKEVQFFFGRCYADGVEGSKGDPILAETWLLKSAKQEYAPACYELGWLYTRMMPSEENMIKGFQWYRKAADLNYPMGVYALGCAYLNGIGTEINLLEAYKNFKRAAEEFRLECAYSDLGMCYEYGVGVESNRELAKSWYEKSMNAGCASGAANLARIYLEDREYRKVLECERKIKELWQEREQRTKP